MEAQQLAVKELATAEQSQVALAELVPFLIENLQNKLKHLEKDNHMSLSDEEQFDSLKSFAKNMVLP